MTSPTEPQDPIAHPPGATPAAPTGQQPPAPQPPAPLPPAAAPGGEPEPAAWQPALGSAPAPQSAAAPVYGPPAVSLRGLTKTFGHKVAVAGISLDIPSGSFYGLVGPNGAGKTTLVSMATGLLRPDAGTATICGVDMWADPFEAKRILGVLPDGMAIFDRLTGTQLVTYAGLLRGMDRETVAARTADLLAVLDLREAADTLVVDYSAGMTKKITLAAALIHAPRVLVLDEPFEAVDPVSASHIRAILADYVASGGTVIVSSHVMDLVQRMCDHVAVVVDGQVRAAGTVDQVRAGRSLEERFVELAGGQLSGEGLSWLRSS